MYFCYKKGRAYHVCVHEHMAVLVCVCVHPYTYGSEAYKKVVVAAVQKMKHGIEGKREDCTVPYRFHTVIAIFWGYILKNTVHCETVMHKVKNLGDVTVCALLLNTKGLF